VDAVALPYLRAAGDRLRGGCRCQAFHLTGDLAATDPACRWSPAHSLVQQARLDADRLASEPLIQPRLLKNGS
jgi:pyrroloquinoline quinone biosynthesis protein E